MNSKKLQNELSKIANYEKTGKSATLVRGYYDDNKYGWHVITNSITAEFLPTVYLGANLREASGNLAKYAQFINSFRLDYQRESKRYYANSHS